jgi:cytochrome c biogenesis protein CcdA
MLREIGIAMIGWLEQLFKVGVVSWAVFPAAILAGVLASATSCCSAGVIGAIASYSGTAPNRSRRSLLSGGLCFMFGAILAFMALGAVAGFFGQWLAKSVGRYWKVIAALVLIAFGLIQLKLLPVTSFALKPRADRSFTGIRSYLLFGLSLGGIASGCDFTCNPLISALLGLILLRGDIVWGALLLFCFAVGYALLPTGLLAGAGLGWQAAGVRFDRAFKAMQPVAGAGLVLVGFYLLFSL